MCTCSQNLGAALPMGREGLLRRPEASPLCVGPCPGHPRIPPGARRARSCCTSSGSHRSSVGSCGKGCSCSCHAHRAARETEGPTLPCCQRQRVPALPHHPVHLCACTASCIPVFAEGENQVAQGPERFQRAPLRPQGKVWGQAFTQGLWTEGSPERG